FLNWLKHRNNRFTHVFLEWAIHFNAFVFRFNLFKAHACRCRVKTH
ncbi:hypothetical protein D022_4140B, partial [Vibrio parahaemolyticus 12310]